MKLTVIVPTYNRAESLRKTLMSFSSAAVPTGLKVEIIVADNNSTDNTHQVVEEVKSRFSNHELKYFFESKQGRSHAVNAGIRISDADLISTIDDDEQVSSDWFREIYRIFHERWYELDFVGGKILPNLEADPPDWVEPLKVGALCWRDFGDEEWPYDLNSPIITGAHGIFKRSIFGRIGLYNEALGVRGRGFLGGEDEVLYDQLIQNGFRGVYDPKLVVYHDVPARRLTKSFYRRWLIGVGMSRRLADLHYKPIPGIRIFDIPRWMYKWAAAGFYQFVKNKVVGNTTEALEAENRPLVFLGFFYAAHIKGGPLDKIVTSIASRFAEPVSR